MKILGIDPGFNKLGYAVIQKEQTGFDVIVSSLIETKSGE